MKDPVVRTHTLTTRTSRLVVMVVFAAFLCAVPFHAALAAGPPDLGTAANFAVLGGTAVTCTDSLVIGDMGVYPSAAFTQTNCTIYGTVHAGDSVAKQASEDFLKAYTDLGNVPCGGVTLSLPLAGQFLNPGVYCFDAAVTETGGTLWLINQQNDPNPLWIFKIGTGGTGALTGTNFTVQMSIEVGTCTNVFWWTAQGATLTDSVFIGSILAGAAITVTRGTFNGDAFAKAAVTLTDTNFTGCGIRPPFPPPFPPYPPIKVTGGGQIPVPNLDSMGRATFGFNAQPNKKGGAKGNLNYVNHVTGLHVNGSVTDIQVIKVYADGSPMTVLFSGTWEGGFFFVTVEDHGEPGTNDQFGITVTTAKYEPIEVTSQRVISNGNIQFHK
jgi:hypothetical protein